MCGFGNTIMYAGTVRARADAINGFGNIRMISHAGPYKGPMKPLNASLCYIYQVKPEYVPFDQ